MVGVVLLFSLSPSPTWNCMSSSRHSYPNVPVRTWFHLKATPHPPSPKAGLKCCHCFLHYLTTAVTLLLQKANKKPAQRRLLACRVNSLSQTFCSPSRALWAGKWYAGRVKLQSQARLKIRDTERRTKRNWVIGENRNSILCVSDT